MANGREWRRYDSIDVVYGPQLSYFSPQTANIYRNDLVKAFILGLQGNWLWHYCCGCENRVALASVQLVIFTRSIPCIARDLNGELIDRQNFIACTVIARF